MAFLIEDDQFSAPLDQFTGKTWNTSASTDPWIYEVVSEYLEGSPRNYEEAKSVAVSDNSAHADISTSPYWLIAVVRLAVPVTYSRNKVGSRDDVNASEAAHLRNNVMLIGSDCFNLQITNRKEAHSKMLQASLYHSDTNYLKEILPGDWVLAWIVNSEEQYKSLVQRISKLNPENPCNGFMDGFKFMGRVHSIRRTLSSDPSTGRKHSTYSLQALSFQELDSQIFYDPQLGEADLLKGKFGEWMARLGLDADTILRWTTDHHQGPNAEIIILSFLDLLVGHGVPPRSLTPTTDKVPVTENAAVGTGVLGKETPYAYLVPRSVGAMIGRSQGSKGQDRSLMSYADLLEVLHGIQRYEQPGFTPHLEQGEYPPSENRKYTGSKVLGTYLAVIPEFTNASLWQIMQQYSNHTINELYTVMRVNDKGLVVPTLVYRQIPFTTDAFTGKVLETDDKTVTPSVKDTSYGKEFGFTRFLDLPRWKISPNMVYHLDIGRSNQTRCNFVHVYGVDSSNGSGVPITHQIVDCPPIRDDLDIHRSGLYSHMTTVACAVDDQVAKAPATWMALIADRMMGSQLTLNGTVITIGIQAPICEGDNVEIDGVVFHIEGVSHQCSVNDSGVRTFRTTLSLSNGMRSQRSDGKDMPLYPSMARSTNPPFDVVSDSEMDSVMFMPGISSEDSLTHGETEQDLAEGEVVDKG